MAWSIVGLGTTVAVASGNVALTEPAGVASGDLLVACIGYRSNVAFTLPSGWALCAESNTGDTQTTANGDGSVVMAYIVRGGSAPALTFTRTGGDAAIGRIVAYRGSTSTPFRVGSATKTGSSTTAVQLGAIEAALDDLCVIAIGGGGDTTMSSAQISTNGAASGATDTTTAPSTTNCRERHDSLTTSGADTTLAIADVVVADGGARTTGTGAINVTMAGAFFHAIAAATFKMSGARQEAILFKTTDNATVSSAGTAPALGTLSKTLADATVSATGYQPEKITIISDSGPVKPTSGAFTLPTPSGVQANDLFVMVLADVGGSAPTLPSGWQVATSIYSSTGVTVAYATHSGSMPTLTGFTTSHDDATAVLLVYRHADGAMQHDQSAIAEVFDINGTVTSFNTGANDAVLVGFGTSDTLGESLSALDSTVHGTSAGATLAQTIRPREEYVVSGQTSLLVSDVFHPTAGATGDWSFTGTILSGNKYTGVSSFVLMSNNRTGTLNKTLGAATVTASGVAPVVGSASKTADAATLSAQGAVLAVGTASRTLSDATVSSAGTARAAGTLSATAAAATVSSVGVAPIAGAAAITTANATVASAGVAPVVGASSRTLADAALSSAGVAPEVGTLSKTLDAATLGSAGGVLVQGSLTKTLDAATLSATGDAATPAATGTLTATLADASISSAGATRAAGSASLTTAAATVSAAGVAPVVGSATISTGNATLASSGVAPEIGSLSKTLDAASLSSAGSARAAGTASLTTADATGSSAGTARVAGILSATTANATLSSAGSAPVVGSATLATADASLVATGAAISGALGSAALTTADASLTSAGIAPVRGTGSPTTADATSAATGSVQVIAQAALTTGAATVSAVGGVRVQGSASLATGDATLSAGGTAPQPGANGSLSLTLGAATASATGTAPVAGTLTSTLGDASVVAAGRVLAQGATSGTLAEATCAATAQVEVRGAAVCVLEAAGSASAGTVLVRGTLALATSDAICVAGGVAGAGDLVSIIEVAVVFDPGISVFATQAQLTASAEVPAPIALGATKEQLTGTGTFEPGMVLEGTLQGDAA